MFVLSLLLPVQYKRCSSLSLICCVTLGKPLSPLGYCFLISQKETTCVNSEGFIIWSFKETKSY